MRTPYIVYRPGELPEDGEVDWPQKPGLATISALVTPLLGGAHLEHVTVLHEGERRDLFVDELSAVKAVEPNSAATEIYRRAWLSTHPGADPDSLPAIYGTAVFFPGRQVWW